MCIVQLFKQLSLLSQRQSSLKSAPSRINILDNLTLYSNMKLIFFFHESLSFKQKPNGQKMNQLPTCLN